MTNSPNGAYRFRVSDTVDVPLRGVMLRLKLLDGRPALKRLEPGETIKLVAPNGESRAAEVVALSVTGGKATQKRLERNRQLDVVISPEAARADGRAVEIGWFVVGD